MSVTDYSIERLAQPVSDEDVRALASLLVEAVASGAAVSFLAPLTAEAAECWWRESLSSAHPRAIVLVARVAGEIVGTVQVVPAWAPNQPHRAEVVKLLVAPGRRGHGLGARLMQVIEEAAQREGFQLLTLDARAGGAAERLYRRLGWTALGTIPGYALDPDATTLHDAVFLYKRLHAG